MANSFKKRIAGSVGTTVRDVYVAGAGVQATVIGMTVANIVTSPVSANVIVYNATGANSAFLVRNATIATGGTLITIGGDQKLVLEPGDKIQVQMSAASAGDVIVSVLEIT
jgi:hypothetical protein